MYFSKHPISVLMFLIAAVIIIGSLDKLGKPAVPTGHYVQITPISWNKAVDDIEGGLVDRVYLLPATRVVVLQLDDKYFQVTEPAGISTYQEVVKCGDTCDQVKFSLVRQLGTFN